MNFLWSNVVLTEIQGTAESMGNEQEAVWDFKCIQGLMHDYGHKMHCD